MSKMCVSTIRAMLHRQNLFKFVFAVCILQCHLKTLRISQCYYKYTKVFPKNKIKNKSYTLKLLMLWVSSFT